MYIVIAAATSLEVQPFVERLEKGEMPLENHKVEVLITGVGILASTYAITTSCHKKPDLIIQAGIAGTFNPKFPPGSITLVKEEASGDCGVTENKVFKDVFDLQFADPNKSPFTNKKMVNPNIEKWQHFGLPLATGLTVNQISTDPDRIQQLKEKYGCDIESMEGASLHYACLNSGIDFLQLRAISNNIGIRDKKEWKIKEAVTLLNDTLFKIIQTLP
jgi:futalosine hydrolase